MSSQLISIFMPNAPIYLEGQDGEDDKALWKVVLRTGTWKLRPGPGGMKIKEPLKIYRDKAPRGHISMSSLVKNFDAGAKENVTLPAVHADGTTSDSGFVRKLVIQDVKDDDGKVKESLLWAKMDVTDSEVKRKIDEKSLVGVSGGILFDYERTEDAKKFDQILSHVVITNSPWINGTGGFTDKLPQDVMASESEDLPIGEVEFESRVTEEDPHLPNVTLDDPPSGEPPEPGKGGGKVLWKPEQGFRFAQDKITKALRQWREQAMSSLPAEQRYSVDWPYYHVEDVTLSGDSGTALIKSGYGSEQEAWVAEFKLDSDREAEIEPFVKWAPAKQEWVAASEDTVTPPPGRPAGRAEPSRGRSSDHRTSDPRRLGLREAQAARVERMKLGTPNPTGGPMGRLTDLLQGVELTDEQRESLLAEERRLAGYEENDAQRRARERNESVVKYCGTPDGETKGVLDNLGLGDPGVKKYVRNALLSDDGGPAIELSEHLEDGQKTAGVPKTATDLLKGFIDVLPKAEDGKVSLSQQARRLPDDPPPPTSKDDDEEKDPKKRADTLLADLGSQGLLSELSMPTSKEA